MIFSQRRRVHRSQAQIIYDSYELVDFEDELKEEQEGKEEDSLIPAVDQLRI